MDKHRFAERMQAGKQKYYRMAYCYVKNEHDALDIVSEAAYKGLKNIHTLRQPEYFDTWMTRIVMNAATDFLRKNARCTPCEDTVLETVAVPEQALTPEDSLDLYAALGSLGDRDRSCVVLRYFEGYGFSEIADILQEAEPAVKSRLYRALKKMRVVLEKGDAGR
ncbi:sigma-70 family RNA polymerase sigma factor [Oscillibacter sp.]|uniref:sigma-70 family RNA polymerase sigma factor n=1 Tax=Oscillibacter sp. TaxID=1945593 RepID=UPI002611819D|nr:sigma-70 family RNA polymerase sigma factor [Oscillibacter sp.]MDD3346673.1 sigma-70 family RNA polymerase sigma factor [Oscillibacter sp.]